MGPNKQVISWNKIFINGYKFHTSENAFGKKTVNSGVWVKGSVGGGSDLDYFGMLDEVVQLDYQGAPPNWVFLFNRTWYNPTLRKGIQTEDEEFNIIEVKHRGRYHTYDPFIIT